MVDTLFPGPLFTYLGHSPPRGTIAAVSDPSTLDYLPTHIILGNSRVEKLMKVLEIRGFAVGAGSITFHVSSEYQNPQTMDF